jgi:hypothetical protein
MLKQGGNAISKKEKTPTKQKRKRQRQPATEWINAIANLLIALAAVGTLIAAILSMIK